MNIAYFGSPPISALLLEKLLELSDNTFNISLVITQPDKPTGKRLEIQPTAVKKIAQAYKLPFFDLNLKLDKKKVLSMLSDQNIELCIIFAYGEIINKELLSQPKYGFWNIHPSLLPLYRGPSPTTYTLLLDDTKTGTTLIQLNERMDAGPIIEQAETNIKPSERRNNLEERLTLIGADLLIKNIKNLVQNGTVDSRPQNDSRATYTRLLQKDDGFISLDFLRKSIIGEDVTVELCPVLFSSYIKKYGANLNITHINASKLIHNYFRALSPWPGIWTKITLNNAEKRLKIIDLELIEGKIELKKVQIEGKKAVDFATFNKAYKFIGLK